ATVASVASVAVAEVKNVHSESFPQATVATVAGVAVARTENAKTGSVATVATVAVANSKYPKPKLAEPWRDALVAEFIEVDGLSPEQAQAMAAISVQPRTPAVWLAMIAELNTLINTYCDSAQVSQEAKQRLHAVAASQSLASIPTAIEWFRAELRTLNASTLLKAQND
ncbi:hypothetical protein, partial [Massilia pseudoviolaceinigra]|uniref:hypothetical protein n=1 Tax=Massilia pseudoviolaceinigra TaxID=3057165 RepID=UPI0027964FF5